MRFLPLLLFALPFVEIAGFVIVGSHIGVLWTLALVVAAGMLGAVLLRFQGFGAMTRARAELAAGGDPSRGIADAAMILVAGILLLIPGFVTDIAGLLLFLPPVRHLAWRFLSRRIAVSTNGFAGFGQTGFGHAGFGKEGSGRRGRDRTIDLDADEYSRDRGERGDSPWKQPPGRPGRIDGD